MHNLLCYLFIHYFYRKQRHTFNSYQNRSDIMCLAMCTENLYIQYRDEQMQHGEEIFLWMQAANNCVQMQIIAQ